LGRTTGWPTARATPSRAEHAAEDSDRFRTIRLGLEHDVLDDSQPVNKLQVVDVDEVEEIDPREERLTLRPEPWPA
jgi:hypothetical protein